MTDGGGREASGREAPDIEFGAEVRARGMRFERVPETEVRLRGHAEEGSVVKTDREGLPERVEPGVTYRSAEVRLRIAASHETPDASERRPDVRERRGRRR